MTTADVPSNSLLRALADPGDPPLRAPHDVAVRLADWVAQHCPELDFDRSAVLFGAATHDGQGRAPRRVVRSRLAFQSLHPVHG